MTDEVTLEDLPEPEWPKNDPVPEGGVPLPPEQTPNEPVEDQE